MQEGVFNKHIYYMLHESAARIADQHWFVYENGQKLAIPLNKYNPYGIKRETYREIADHKLFVDVESMSSNELEELKEDLKKHLIHYDVQTVGDRECMRIKYPEDQALYVFYENNQGFLGRAPWKDITHDCGGTEKRLNTSHLSPHLTNRYVETLKRLGIPYAMQYDEDFDVATIVVQDVHADKISEYQYNVVQNTVNSHSHVNGIFKENNGFYDPNKDAVVFVRPLTGDVVTIYNNGQTDIEPCYTHSAGMKLWGQKLIEAAEKLGDLPPMIEGGVAQTTSNGSYWEAAESMGDFSKFFATSEKIGKSGGKIARGVTKTFKSASQKAGWIGLVLQINDLETCLQNMDLYVEAGIISEEAASDYNWMIARNVAADTLNAFGKFDDYLMKNFKEWGDKHNIPTYFRNGVNPGTLTEAIVDLANTGADAIGLDVSVSPKDVISINSLDIFTVTGAVNQFFSEDNSQESDIAQLYLPRDNNNKK